MQEEEKKEETIAAVVEARPVGEEGSRDNLAWEDCSGDSQVYQVWRQQ